MCGQRCPQGSPETLARVGVVKVLAWLQTLGAKGAAQAGCFPSGCGLGRWGPNQCTAMHQWLLVRPAITWARRQSVTQLYVFAGYCPLNNHRC